MDFVPVPRDGHTSQVRLQHRGGAVVAGARVGARAVPRRDGGVVRLRGQPLRGGARQIRQRLRRHTAGLCQYIQELLKNSVIIIET